MALDTLISSKTNTKQKKSRNNADETHYRMKNIKGSSYV